MGDVKMEGGVIIGNHYLKKSLFQPNLKLLFKIDQFGNELLI